MQPINAQVYSFLGTIIIGLVLGLFFDFYRVFRAIVKPKRILTYLGDFLFGILATIIVFLLLLYSNWGEFRLYVFIGMTLGLLLYFGLLSPWVVKGLIRLCRLIKKALVQLKKLLKKLRPKKKD